MTDTCEVCGRTQTEHNNSSVVHRFTPPGTSVDTSQFGPKRPKNGARGNHPGDVAQMHVDTLKTPFDPVLRLALIDAGVITPDQLEAAQRKMTLFTQQVTGGDPNGGIRTGPTGS